MSEWLLIVEVIDMINVDASVLVQANLLGVETNEFFWQ